MQRQRFLRGGWERADARDMATIHRCHIDPAGRQRWELQGLAGHGDSVVASGYLSPVDQRGFRGHTVAPANRRVVGRQPQGILVQLKNGMLGTSLIDPVTVLAGRGLFTT